MAKLVSNVYGEALFELAMEQDRLDAYLEESQGVLDVLRDNQEFSQMMTHPNIIKEEKLQMVETVFKGRISDEMVGLMRMIVEKDHFAKMPEVLTLFIDKALEEKKIGIAYVTTPMEVTDAQKKQIEDRLLETTAYQSFRMHYAVDADLIGGMVIRIGDRVVDSSVRTKISELSRELSKIQLKVGESAS